MYGATDQSGLMAPLSRGLNFVNKFAGALGTRDGSVARPPHREKTNTKQTHTYMNAKSEIRTQDPTVRRVEDIIRVVK
jgi:hypothetical protein